MCRRISHRQTRQLFPLQNLRVSRQLSPAIAQLGNRRSHRQAIRRGVRLINRLVDLRVCPVVNLQVSLLEFPPNSLRNNLPSNQLIPL